MKIIDVGIYKDGGSIDIITDQGNYWIPATLGKDDKTMTIFKGETFHEKDGVLVTDQQEILSLIVAMAQPTHRYFWIKRHVS